MRDEIRSLILKLTALDGKLEQSLKHLHSEISQSSAPSANLNNQPTIHQETRLLQHQDP